MVNDVKIGIIGTGRIARPALLNPVRRRSDVRVVAVASRTRARAEDYARRHGIERPYRGYEELLADDGVDAVYLALPSSLHEDWIMEALAAGKHVLCEKPFTSNSAAAARVIERSASSASVVMEAYHSHYHPLQTRLRELLLDGIVGDVYAAEARFHAPIPSRRDIRWDFGLGGGALLDIGYYPLRQLRALFGEFTGITDARARVRGNIDADFEADLEFGGGIRGTVATSMTLGVPSSLLRIRGSRGTLTVANPQRPIGAARIRVSRGARIRVHRLVPVDTYDAQLDAFLANLRGVRPVETGAAEAQQHLEAIDSLYRSVGLDPRPSWR